MTIPTTTIYRATRQLSMRRRSSSSSLSSKSNNNDCFILTLMKASRVITFVLIITMMRSFHHMFQTIFITGGVIEYVAIVDTTNQCNCQIKDPADPGETIPVFYNLFVNDTSDDEELERVSNLVQEQFSSIKPWHTPIYVHSIGQEFPIPNTTLLQHHTTATEMVTLDSLWEYCQNHTDDKVVYLHSKGSFHPSKKNDRFRKLITLGALSDHCANAPSTCNVCSSRFSPFPHPHPPGNMWLARCSYVQKLPSPSIFEQQMEEVKLQTVGPNSDIHGSQIGVGRFAAEHWIHSHPTAKPCDLYNNRRYQYGYERMNDNVDVDKEFDLHIGGPRYGKHKWGPGESEYTTLPHRLTEYKILFNLTPPDDWWGWSFWWDDV
jgi:hypothetical protein